jgi:hypothetical protein
MGRRMPLTGDLTRPENCAELRDRRRIKALLVERGGCWACVHRDQEVMFWGRSVCKANNARSFPLCLKDNKAPAFEMDEAQVKEALR